MAVETLQPPDTHYLSAALGWLGLGDSLEANLELERISPEAQLHPGVLEAGWQIRAKEGRWETCVELARKIIGLEPKESFGWIHLSFALHELKRTGEAHANLAGVLEQFPDEWLMRYNLACYSCQLGNLEEAARWLAGASLKGDPREIKQMAKEDPDLAALFKVAK